MTDFPSTQQRAILKVLWHRSGTVSDVQEALQHSYPVTYSTIATVLTRMENKGLVRRRKSGRRFIYEAVIPDREAGRSLAGDLIQQLFDGSPSQLVSHLLDSESVDAEELTRIRKLVADYESRQQSGRQPPASRRRSEP